MKDTGWMRAVRKSLGGIFGCLSSLRLDSVRVEEPLSKRLLGLETTRPEKEDNGKWVLFFTMFDSGRTYTFGVLTRTYILSLGERDLLSWDRGIPVALVYDDATDKIEGWVDFEQVQGFGEGSGYSFLLHPLKDFRAFADLQSLAEKEQKQAAGSPVSSQ